MDNKRQEEMLCGMPSQKADLLHPDPDPETEKMIEALEDDVAEITPDELLLGAMESVCEQLDTSVAEMREWGASTAQLVEINRSVNDLAGTAMRMYERLTIGKTIDKIHLMHEADRRNEESIRKWSERHEAVCKAAAGDEGTECAQHGHRAGAEAE